MGTATATATSKTTIPSVRIYLDGGGIYGDTGMLRETLSRFSRIVEKQYNRAYECAFINGTNWQEGFTQSVKQDYAACYQEPMSEYYVTSAYSRVSGMIASQKEAEKLHAQDRLAKIQSCEAKIRELELEKGRLAAWKAYIVSYYRARRQGAPAPTPPGDFYILEKEGVPVQGFTARVKSRDGKWRCFNLYREECYIDRRLKRIPPSIASIKEKIRRMENRNSLPPRRVTFGGRKFYKSKDTLAMDKEQRAVWREEREQKRCGAMLVSGRAASRDGNFACVYDPAGKTVRLTLINKEKIVIHGVVFPYRGEELKAHIAGRKGAIGYQVELRKDRAGREYLIIKATFDATCDRVNSYYGDGCVAFDLNADNFAVAELDSSGCLVRSLTLPFCLDGLNSSQREQALAVKLRQIFGLAAEARKPVAMEDLDFMFKKRNLSKYGDKGYNRMVSSFAYHKVRELASSLSVRTGTMVFAVNPAYTSFIAKLKYTRRMGAPVHEAAAYVIGRRAMGLGERVPGYLKAAVGKGSLAKGGNAPWAELKKNIPPARPSLFLDKLPGFHSKRELGCFFSLYQYC